MAETAHEEEGVFLGVARDIANVLTGLDAASSEMGALYQLAITTAEHITALMKRRGQPGQSARPHELMEWALLTQWLQLTESFASQYLAVTVQQGAQLARASRGIGLVNLREMHNPPNPRMLKP